MSINNNEMYESYLARKIRLQDLLADLGETEVTEHIEEQMQSVELNMKCNVNTAISDASVRLGGLTAILRSHVKIVS